MGNHGAPAQVADRPAGNHAAETTTPFAVQNPTNPTPSQMHTPSPDLMNGFAKNKVSPGQFLYSIQKPDGTISMQPGQVMIVQGGLNGIG